MVLPTMSRPVELHVLGRTRLYGEAFVVIAQTSLGWSQHAVPWESTQEAVDCLRCDYVSNESVDDILSWIACDFQEKKIYRRYV